MRNKKKKRNKIAKVLLNALFDISLKCDYYWTLKKILPLVCLRLHGNESNDKHTSILLQRLKSIWDEAKRRNEMLRGNISLNCAYYAYRKDVFNKLIIKNNFPKESNNRLRITFPLITIFHFLILQTFISGLM